MFFQNDSFMRQLTAFFLEYRENSPRFRYLLKAEHIECIHFCFCIMIYAESGAISQSKCMFLGNDRFMRQLQCIYFLNCF